jgi:drug/metabolite transporter (DMT)-like permease
VFLFGLSGLFGKMVTTTPVAIVFSRSFIAAVVLGMGLWMSNTPTPSKSKDWVYLAASGMVLAVHWWTFFKAIQVSTVAIGVLSFSSFPLFTTLLEPAVSRERLRTFDVLTCAVVLVGLSLITPSLHWNEGATQGVAWGLLSGLSFAGLSILNRQFVRELTPLTLAFGQNAAAAVCLAPFAVAGARALTPKDAALLLVLGVLCTACAHFLFIRGLAVVRAQVASILTCLEPVYGIVLAWIVLGERPAARVLLGGGIILGTAALSTCLRARSGKSN